VEKEAATELGMAIAGGLKGEVERGDRVPFFCVITLRSPFQTIYPSQQYGKLLEGLQVR
jgi:hypothetical protein